MQLQIDENNIILGYATFGGFENGIEVSEDFIDKLDKDKLGYLIFNGADKEPTFDEKAYNEFQNKTKINELRTKRENECFSYINRGEPWYQTLSSEQKKELKTWYQAWLDVTDTKVIPEKPDWLNK